MRVVCLLLVCAAVLVSASSDIPSDVQNGFFPGRSGAVILKASSDANKLKDSLIVLVDRSGRFYSKPPTVENTIDSRNFVDLVARSLGMDPIHNDWTPAFISANPFDRPSASLTLSIESLGEDQLNKFNLRNLQALRDGQGISFRTRYDAFPDNALSIAASLASGALPKEHGIVGSSWLKPNGEVVSAYSASEPSSFAQGGNLADMVTLTFRGKSLVVSASGSAQQAAANSPNPSVTSSHPSTSFCLSLDKNGEWKNVCGGSGPAADALAAKDLRSRLEATDDSSVLSALGSGVKASVRGGVVTVHYPATWGNGEEMAQFDLSIPEEALLFMEMQYAHTLASKLSNAPLSDFVHDSTPDLLTFTFSALTGLMEKYGRESSEVIAALQLLDAAVPQLLKKYDSVYGSRLVAQVVLLGSHKSTEAADTRSLFSQIHRLLPHQERVTDFFPYLYLGSLARAEVDQICQVLSLEVQRSGYNAYCPRASTTSFQSLSKQPRMITLATTTSAANNGTVTKDDVARFQIVLWLSIVLVLTVAAAGYSLAFMSIKKDTLLYGSFNPNWEERKRH